MNSLRHWLLSRHAVVADEDPAAFDDLRQQLVVQLAPVGALEEAIVDRMTVLIWRLRRVVRLESGVITHRTNEANSRADHDGIEGDALVVGLVKDATGADALSKLSRYERGLERGLYRALHELQRLHASRRGESVSTPAVLDVQVSTDDL